MAWFAAVGRLQDGSEVDLYRHLILGEENGGVDWACPPVVRKDCPNARWRKHLINLRNQRHAGHRVLFCRYLAREWDMKFAETRPLVGVDLFSIEEGIRPLAEQPAGATAAVLIHASVSRERRLKIGKIQARGENSRRRAA